MYDCGNQRRQMHLPVQKCRLIHFLIVRTQTSTINFSLLAQLCQPSQTNKKSCPYFSSPPRFFLLSDRHRDTDERRTLFTQTAVPRPSNQFCGQYPFDPILFIAAQHTHLHCLDTREGDEFVS